MRTKLTFLFGFILVTAFAQKDVDVHAMELVNAMEEAMGGSENYNATRYLTWNFLGGRSWVWDKWTGDVRCDYNDGSFKVAMNINSMEGTVYAHGQIQTNADSLSKFLERGYRLWINDSYWLVMPWKLKDPGTRLKYIGKQETVEGTLCEVAELTFENVGVTPDNKYHLYFDPETNLICQWDYYSKYDNPEPRFQRPWTDYKKYGKIRLSSGRGQRDLKPISTPKDLSIDDIYNLDLPMEEVIR